MSDPGVEPRLSSSDNDALRRALSDGFACFEALAPSGQALVAWSLAALSKRMVIWIADGPHSLEILARDLEALAPAERADMCVYPARETGGGRSTDTSGERLEALRRCRSDAPPAVLATCIQALMQPAVDTDRMDRLSLAVRVGSGLRPDAFAEALQQAGYEFSPQVDAKGQASCRGGIVDVWSPQAEWPVRVEFLGDAVDSMRTFDPWAQRSIHRVESATFLPAREESPAAGAGLLDRLPPEVIRVWNEPDRLREHARMHEAAETGAAPAGGEADGGRYDAIRSASVGVNLEFSALDSPDVPLIRLGVRPLDPLPDLSDPRRRGEWSSPDAIAGLRAERVRDLAARARRGGEVWFVFTTDGARDRFLELYTKGARWPAGARVTTGPLSEGFELSDGSLMVVAEGDLFPRRSLRGRVGIRRGRSGPGRGEGERIREAGQMEPGDIVVHVDHGIGRYMGIFEIEVGGRPREALTVEYADNAKLYIPVDQAHLLSRYVGVGVRAPELHRLGGRRWRTEREAAERAVRDLAADLLKTQAVRETRPGRAFAPDTPWQHELETAFPFPETDDQLRAIADVKRDMEAPKPMDRLICGDVGYGKTEVAMRAAFKAVMDSCQVAVLVPTTILAQQHYDTFRERMAAFPVTIEMLSRFRTRGEQRRVVAGLRDGSVDIVIGTHRLVQPDVAFKTIGLIIIDEEQRFGVEHKEALKRWRSEVDVLTMTATPIPRTLYLGLTGARDLSVIQTPPRERLAVETIVAAWDEDLVRRAILRELDREGQVFFLHNRVMTIGARLDALRALVPEARIEAAHGQMNEGELEDLMRSFMAGGFDVLLCTTIIESGVDIPRVNTILIERADRFGMADLYQLRGRVGRAGRQAHAILLLPRHGRLLDTARQRIGALRRHSGLGAGFRLALRDLETRGAGNLLGAEQSGHIAAVGFDLYCQLLRRTVATLRGEREPSAPATARLSLDFINISPVSGADAAAAAIPSDYIEDEPLRLQLYRRIAGAGSEREIRALAAEFRDRFGPVPPPLDRLLRLARLRSLATANGIEAIETDGDRAILYRNGEPVLIDGHIPRLTARDPSKKIAELIRLVAGRAEKPRHP